MAISFSADSTRRAGERGLEDLGGSPHEKLKTAWGTKHFYGFERKFDAKFSIQGGTSGIRFLVLISCGKAVRFLGNFIELAIQYGSVGANETFLL